MSSNGILNLDAASSLLTSRLDLSGVADIDMDGVVGAMHEALMTKKMWDNTLWFHQSDNGGPSFSGSSHTANN